MHVWFDEFMKKTFRMIEIVLIEDVINWNSVEVFPYPVKIVFIYF